MNMNVTTLALGSRPRQKLAKMRVKNEARESHFMFLRGWEYGRVGELNLNTPKRTPTSGVGFLMDFQIFRERL
jgi:hypothetical protein